MLSWLFGEGEELIGTLLSFIPTVKLGLGKGSLEMRLFSDSGRGRSVGKKVSGEGKRHKTVAKAPVRMKFSGFPESCVTSACRKFIFKGFVNELRAAGILFSDGKGVNYLPFLKYCYESPYQGQLGTLLLYYEKPRTLLKVPTR